MNLLTGEVDTQDIELVSGKALGLPTGLDCSGLVVVRDNFDW